MRGAAQRDLIHDEAFITSIVRYGEADCIVRLFLQEQGKISAFFKNGLVFKKNRQGIMQAPAFARVAYVPRQEEKMARLNSSDLAPESFLWASSLKLFAYGNYLAELIEKLLPEEEPAPLVFSCLQETLEACARHGAQGSILRAFELKLLESLGYLPQIPEAESPLFYDPIACHFSVEEQPQGFIFSPAALKLAHALLLAPIGEVLSEEEEDLTSIARIFFSRLRLMNVLPLKSLAFFKQLSSEQKTAQGSGKS